MLALATSCMVIASYTGLPYFSRSGVIPLDSTSDVAGPIARTVEDAVRLFEVTVGVDPSDNLTSLQDVYTMPDNYTQFLQANALKVSLPSICSYTKAFYTSCSRKGERERGGIWMYLLCEQSLMIHLHLARLANVAEGRLQITWLLLN